MISPTKPAEISEGVLSTSDKACYVNKRGDTVGELKSAEMCVSHMPSWKAKKPGKLTQEKVLLEL
jgi:hypothetical protein